ncbi:MAG: glyoxalase, partial [Xanthobacteraceae bacterium]
MAYIKVADMAYGRLRSPDLDKAEEFLTRFGLVRTARTPTALYMRGTDPPHHIHVTEKGDSKFVGFAYHAASEDDLKRLAKAPGASGVEHLDEPGGGQRVRLTEPNGYQIEVIYGMEKLAPIPVKRQRVNSGPEPLARAGELMRIKKGPSSVKRIAHGVLNTPKFEETLAWFRDYLGFICSDDVYAGEKEHLIGSFNRLDCGDTFVDHHVFFVLRHEKTGLNHLSFEVQDIDDVCIGHDYLTQC